MSSTPTTPLVLLGPQGKTVTVAEAFRAAAPEGPVAAITAGWYDREPKDTELNDLLGGRTQNLTLYARAERVWREDPALRRAHNKIQDRLRLLRRSYQVQLDCVMNAWIAVEGMEGEAEVLEDERRGALNAVRQLDDRHLRRVAELRAEYDEQVRPLEREAVKRERDEIAAILHDARAIAIAGGHVAVLLNRLRLFGVADFFPGRAIVAWSAGAMALSERVVLFHDNPPQGAGFAEAFDWGLGIAPDIIALPHAAERLQLDDPGRVGRLARRFGPARCVTLDHAEGVMRRDDLWAHVDGGSRTIKAPRQLQSDGALGDFAP